MSNQYSEEELAVLQSLFDSCDADRSGRIHINQLAGLLDRLGKAEDEIVSIVEAASRVADENEGQLSFDDFISILAEGESSTDSPFEGPDPKIMEFLRILEEYRLKCEDDGNYLEAGRANRQLTVLRKQEESRQQKAIRARQISERQDVQLAHNMQFSDFNTAWDKYMDEYDNMAQMYIQQMTERHSVVLLEFQKQLRLELSAKPPKWSKELLEQRRKQHINARNKNYAEAQKIKKLSDITEARERKELEQGQAIVFARRESQFRSQQQAELQALLKRIECRRKEHIKQRNQDSKRLLQRNRNVQAVLESKQSSEAMRLFTDIKRSLMNDAIMNGGVSGGGGATSKASSSARLPKIKNVRQEQQQPVYQEPLQNYQDPNNPYDNGGQGYEEGQYGNGYDDGQGEQQQQYGGDYSNGGGAGGEEEDTEFLNNDAPNFNSLVY